jgi:hypothetical protein
MASEMNQFYFADLSPSDDPDVRKWPDVRKHALEKSDTLKAHKPTSTDYSSALRTAIEGNRHVRDVIGPFNFDQTLDVSDNVDLQAEMDSVRNQLRDTSTVKETLISPMRSIRGLIGLILSRVHLPLADHQLSLQSTDAEPYCPYESGE